MANTEKVRLNKYLSQAGICSRREADVLIEGGKVSVNGKIADPGMRVNDLDKITVEDKPVGHREKKVVLAYYKPVGVTCTEKDRHAQITIRDVVEYPVRVTYAGRLDRDSEGLLLLTNDGDLINGLMRAANFHEKEYLVRVNKPISRDFLKKMSDGMLLKDLNERTRPCFVKEEGKFVFPYYPDAGLKPPDPPDVQDPRLWRSKHQTCACGKHSAGEIKPGRYSCSHRRRVKRAVL